MALKARIDQAVKDGLPADLQEHYKEAGEGMFQLDVTSVDGLELAEVGKLRKALESERQSTVKTKEQLKELQETFKDLDPEAARAALAKIEELGEGEWDKDEKLKEAKAALERKFQEDRVKLVKKHTTELEDVTGKYEAVDKQLTQLMIDSAATQAILANKGAVELLKPIVQSAAVLKTVDGKRVVRIIDPADGTERISTKAGSGDPMTIDEFVEELKSSEVYARAFDSSGSSGSGAKGSTGGSGKGRFQMTKAEAADFQKYSRMRLEAEKVGETVQIVE